jgi:hypothetical protein
MDICVALVQTYLHVNGYFTVAEYPVLEAFRGEPRGRSRTSTSWRSGSPAPVTTSFGTVGAALSLGERSRRIRFLAVRLIGRT